MNKKSKGQKLFLLLIISVILVFAFCLTGCANYITCFGVHLRFNEEYCSSSCVGCSSQADFKNQDWYSNISSSCKMCDSTGACAGGSFGSCNEEDASLGIRFISKSDHEYGYDEKVETNAIFGEATLGANEELTGFRADLGTNCSSNTSTSTIEISTEDIGVSCDESNGVSDLYISLIRWLYIIR